ncbi:hypothetical protein C8J57DRAFT_1248069 [Mycena rebaudengoi]|nr:hypothetical protein C8J57DRAFT_1248069 [Mycena rebaudengoi]
MEDVGAHHPGGHLHLVCMSNTIISAFTTTSKARHSRKISTQVKICCKILNKSCIFSKQICQKLTDKEQSALKLEEVYQQNEEDKKDFIKLEAEISRNVQGVESDPQYPTSEFNSMGGTGVLLKVGMGSWAVQVEAFVQNKEEDEVQWDAVKGSSLSEGEGEVMPDQ